MKIANVRMRGYAGVQIDFEMNSYITFIKTTEMGIKYLQSIFFFIIAGFCEIGGGYLVWLWLKEGKPIYYGITGFFILALYGVVATLQTANFARTYATYGGVFIVMALIWAWRIDGFKPDKFDMIGAVVALIGVGIIMYAPRG